MTWFTEAPLFPVLIGLVLSGALAIAWSRTRDRRLLPWLIVAGLLTLLPLVTSMLVVTDREGLERQIRQMANCVRRNDVDGFLRYIDPQARSTFQRIEREMPTYEFSHCSVTAFHQVDISGDEAVARFTVFVNVNAPSHGHQGIAPRGVKLEFRRAESGRWLVTGFSHYSVQAVQRFLYGR